MREKNFLKLTALISRLLAVRLLASVFLGFLALPMTVFAENISDITEMSAQGEIVSDVNVRTGPSTDYEKIGTVREKELVKITGKSFDGWYRIAYDGGDGFIYGKYISVVSEDGSLPEGGQEGEGEGEGEADGQFSGADGQGENGGLLGEEAAGKGGLQLHGGLLKPAAVVIIIAVIIVMIFLTLRSMRQGNDSEEENEGYDEDDDDDEELDDEELDEELEDEELDEELDDEGLDEEFEDEGLNEEFDDRGLDEEFDEEPDEAFDEENEYEGKFVKETTEKRKKNAGQKTGSRAEENVETALQTIIIREEDYQLHIDPKYFEDEPIAQPDYVTDYLKKKQEQEEAEAKAKTDTENHQSAADIQKAMDKLQELQEELEKLKKSKK